MSMLLMAKAMSIKVGNSGRKLVLLKLADNANDHGECWPSHAYIADQCEIGKSTVRRKLKELEDCGFLKTNNRFKDGAQQSNLITLTIQNGRVMGGVTASTPHAQSEQGGCPERAPESVIESTIESVNEPTRETVKRSQARKSRSAESAIPPKTKLTAKDLTADFGIPPDMAAQYLQIRKDKRQTLTPIAMTRLQSEASKAGLTVHDAIRECCANGWAGFKAEWLANQQQRFGGGRTGPPVRETIEERADRRERERQAAAANGEVIDIWATAVEVNHEYL